GRAPGHQDYANSRSHSMLRAQQPSLFYIYSNDPPTTEIYTLSLHDALPILVVPGREAELHGQRRHPVRARDRPGPGPGECRRARSEEHTSELQSRGHLVCRLLLEKKKRTPRASEQFYQLKTARLST